MSGKNLRAPVAPRKAAAAALLLGCGGAALAALAAVLLAALVALLPAAPAAPAWLRANLDGRVCVVTGATGGLGLAHARALLAMNATVVVVGRDERRVQAALRELRGGRGGGGGGGGGGSDGGEDGADGALGVAGGGGAALGGGELLADLSDLRSVRAFAAALSRRFPRVDVLVLNAGVMRVPLADDTRTAQGFEQAVGVNHLAHHLLARLLRPRLEAAARATGDARVVAVSSVGHAWGDLRDGGTNLDHDLAFQRPGRALSQSGFEGYTRSKLANVLFARELARRAAGTGVRAWSLHPGAVATDIFRHLFPAPTSGSSGGGLLGRLGARLGDALEAIAAPLARLVLRSPAVGARAQIFLSAAPLAALAGREGAYFEDGLFGLFPPGLADPRPATWPGLSAQAQDAALAEALWRRSDELTEEWAVPLAELTELTEEWAVPLAEGADAEAGQ
jgi:NAD(P)-dependent dehydrogenase (short-subunit alcohol dehydrogenase family)